MSLSVSVELPYLYITVPFPLETMEPFAVAIVVWKGVIDEKSLES